MVRILADSSIMPCSFALTHPELFEGTGNAAEEQPPADETTIADSDSLRPDCRQIDFTPETTKTTGRGILSEGYYSRVLAERRSALGILPIAATAGLLSGCALSPNYDPEGDVYMAGGNPITGGSLLLTSSIMALILAGVFSRFFGRKTPATDDAKPANAAEK